MTTPAPKLKRTRRSQLTITGGLYPYDPRHANPDHPLAHLTREERLDIAVEALGNLILNAIEDDRREAACGETGGTGRQAETSVAPNGTTKAKVRRANSRALTRAEHS